MDIAHELITGATPDKVFQALTEAPHIASWFAEATQAEPIVGSVAEFRFDRATIRVEIMELVREHKVVWKVLQGMPAWEEGANEVIWQLKPNPFGVGTMINFTHRGWTTTEGTYPSVNFRWARFIARMKTYLETGVASPV